jgi:hypothetical protein
MEMLTPDYPHVYIKPHRNSDAADWQVFTQGRLTRSGTCTTFVEALKVSEEAAEDEWDRLTRAYDSLNDQRLDP